MLWVLVLGFLVGFVAKFLMPGRAPGGIVISILLGIGGAALAHWAGGAFGFYNQGDPVGFIAAVLGAMVIILAYQALTNRVKIV